MLTLRHFHLITHPLVFYSQQTLGVPANLPGGSAPSTQHLKRVVGGSGLSMKLKIVLFFLGSQIFFIDQLYASFGLYKITENDDGEMIGLRMIPNKVFSPLFAPIHALSKDIREKKVFDSPFL